MAVKALAFISGPAPESDGTYKLNIKIWSGANYAEVPNDVFFEPTTASTTVNNSIKGFVEGFIQSEWNVDFNQLIDSVKLINPVSLL